MSDAPTRPPVVVLGLGNVLLTDDGLGIAAVHRLGRDWTMPETVELLDGGTLGLSLLPYIENATHLILVDAVRTGAAPGTLLRVEGEDVGPAVATRLSPHQVGVADLLSGASLIEKRPGTVLLLGIEPGSLELGVERTPAVEGAMGALLEEVVAELGRLGHPPRRRTTPSARGEEPDVARTLGL